ncbi:hypothetical protein [Chitinophaga sp. 212800010-3]|uniref:hypothetical protein n=1 Tax=unclassified Chitinophaga TaxID=2619133 RepID=UPI002DE94CAD|nr:hypothetical protein [Chitinophaga sp. 212800010-3]
MILPIEASDDFFEPPLIVPDGYRYYLIPGALARFTHGDDGIILDQKIPGRKFTGWVHRIWLSDLTLLYPFAIKDTWALHFWLARRIPARLEQGQTIILDDCTLFYLPAAEYTAWPLPGNAISFHINFIDNTNASSTNPDGSHLSKIINELPYPISPVSFRIIKRVLSCKFVGRCAEFYQERNFKNLLDCYWYQNGNKDRKYQLIKTTKSILQLIRERAQIQPLLFTSYEWVAKDYSISVQTLRDGFESYFNIALHDYIHQEKLMTAFGGWPGPTKNLTRLPVT